MRAGIVPLVLGIAAVVAASGIGTAPAQTPLPLPTPAPVPPPLTTADPARLRSDTASLAKEREAAAKDVIPSDAATERAVARARLMDLLKRLEDSKLAVPTPRTVPGSLPRPKFDPGGATPIDTLRMAENLFRDGETAAALGAFQLIDPVALAREDRAFVQYMTACCLRKLNRRPEAANIFRDVAQAREDDFIAECAIGQLSLINSTRELEAQLEQLRPRPKSR